MLLQSPMIAFNLNMHAARQPFSPPTFQPADDRARWMRVAKRVTCLPDRFTFSSLSLSLFFGNNVVTLCAIRPSVRPSTSPLDKLCVFTLSQIEKKNASSAGSHCGSDLSAFCSAHKRTTKKERLLEAGERPPDYLTSDKSSALTITNFSLSLSLCCQIREWPRTARTLHKMRCIFKISIL